MAPADTPEEHLWLIELIVPAAAISSFMGVLDPFAEAVSVFEIEGGTHWRISGYADSEPDPAAIEAAASAIALPLAATTARADS